MNLSRAAAAAAVVVAVGVGIRVTTAAQGWFYWDDLTLLAQARQFPFPSGELLLRPHDGHLMPGSWLIIWLFGVLTEGFNWAAAVGMLAVGQVIAAGAVAYAALRINPSHAWWVTGLYLLTPLTLPTTTWAAAAVNSLPLHAACALWLAHGWLYLRAGRSRDLIITAGAVFGAGLFSERVLLLAPLSLLLLLCWTRAAPRAVPPAKAAVLAAALALPTLVWAGAYLAVVGDPRPSQSDPGAALSLIGSGYLEAFLPTLAGGPWLWERWHPGPPFAAPPAPAIVLGVLVALALLIWAARRRALCALVVTAAYPLLPFLALALARSGADTAAEITQTLRHFAEVAVLLTLTLAVYAQRGHCRAGWILGALFTASALVSTATYAASWAEQPARTYFSTLADDLRERGRPILDQAVPLEVLLPVVHPDNRLRRLLPEGSVTAATRDPTLVAGTGEIVPAQLVPFRATEPEPGCLAAGETRTLALDGPLIERDWVLRLNLTAAGTGEVQIALAGAEPGPPVTVEVGAGPAQWHVQLAGGGTELQVTAGGTEICLGRSEVGLLAPESVS